MSCKQLKFCTWNVNGLRSIIKKGELQRLILKEKPNFLCLNEIRLSQVNINEVENNFPKKYFKYWNTSEEKRGYSGVCTITTLKPNAVLYGINFKESDDEGRVITLEYNNYYLINVYVPNSGQVNYKLKKVLNRLDFRIKDWEPRFRKYIKNMLKYKNVIVTGDFNVAPQSIDLFNPNVSTKSSGYTPQEREEFRKLLKLGMTDCFRHLYPGKINYTYFSARAINSRASNHGWRIDHFLVNKEIEENIKNCEILSEYYGSDHCPIKLKIFI